MIYFSLSNIGNASLRHRGYWNHLYNYVDNLPTMLRDPSGMGSLLGWLGDLFKEKTPEQITTQGLSAGFGALCTARNCGKNRDWKDLYGDCSSLLNSWIEKQVPLVLELLTVLPTTEGRGSSPIALTCARTESNHPVVARKHRREDLSDSAYIFARMDSCCGGADC